MGEVLTQMLALLRALRWNYQTAHWQVSGSHFYGDHLLFQRLYESLDGEIDTLAEKIVGIVGKDEDGQYAFNNISQVEMVHEWLTSWDAISCPIRKSLQAEKDFQRVWGEGYELLSEYTDLSLGLDDWLMSTANAHETNLYLLQQRVAQMEGIRTATQRLLRSWGHPRERQAKKEGD